MTGKTRGGKNKVRKECHWLMTQENTRGHGVAGCQGDCEVFATGSEVLC